MDYEEMSEPNMKLSRALLIVLLLHVVAVSGIIAFNALKTRQTSFMAAAPANTENNPAPSVALYNQLGCFESAILAGAKGTRAREAESRSAQLRNRSQKTST